MEGRILEDAIKRDNTLEKRLLMYDCQKEMYESILRQIADNDKLYITDSKMDLADRKVK